jgi:hypothetical protein
MSTDNMNTQPTITTVLERINQLDGSLRKYIEEAAAETRKYVDEVTAQIRAGMDKNSRSLVRKLEVLGPDIVGLRADIRVLEDRLDSELKPS